MRARGALEKLALHGFRGFALTGSLALHTHLNRLGRGRDIQILNDIDIVVDSFGSIPSTMADAFLFRHIHSKAPEGKMLIQFIDAEAALRIDVFRAYGATMARSQPVCFGASPIGVVSLEDLAARAASLVLDLEGGLEVPLKHATDFEQLVDAVDLGQIAIPWRDHRKNGQPATFAEASARIHDLIQSRRELLVASYYSKDINAGCPKCEDCGPFRSASSARIQSILGYC